MSDLKSFDDTVHKEKSSQCQSQNKGNIYLLVKAQKGISCLSNIMML